MRKLLLLLFLLPQFLFAQDTIRYRMVRDTAFPMTPCDGIKNYESGSCFAVHTGERINAYLFYSFENCVPGWNVYSFDKRCVFLSKRQHAFHDTLIRIRTIVPTDNGDYVIAGYTRRKSRVDWSGDWLDAVALCCSPDGSLRWMKVFENHTWAGLTPGWDGKLVAGLIYEPEFKPGYTPRKEAEYETMHRLKAGMLDASGKFSGLYEERIMGNTWDAEMITDTQKRKAGVVISTAITRGADHHDINLYFIDLENRRKSWYRQITSVENALCNASGIAICFDEHGNFWLFGQTNSRLDFTNTRVVWEKDESLMVRGPSCFLTCYSSTGNLIETKSIYPGKWWFDPKTVSMKLNSDTFLIGLRDGEWAFAEISKKNQEKMELSVLPSSVSKENTRNTYHPFMEFSGPKAYIRFCLPLGKDAQYFALLKWDKSWRFAVLERLQ